MHSLIDSIERFIDWTGRTVSWLTLLMVIVTFIIVVLRYVFDIGWIALQESVTYMHAMVFLVGASASSNVYAMLTPSNGICS